MRRKIPIILLSLILLLLSPCKIEASSQTYLQLDRTKILSNLSGTFCHQPSSASLGVEGKVAITFPSDFTISTGLSSWTTNTNDLPSGSSAWPQIGSNAQAVSSKTVSFASGDLTSSTTLYCFNFSSDTSKTSSTIGSKNASFATFTAGNSQIETKNINLAIIKDDQISVTATIKEKSDNFQVGISKETVGDVFPQYTTIEYKITYGSDLSYQIPLTIEASWNEGEIEGAPGSTVSVLEYVNGSAGLAYNDTVPVIDLVNRKIVWKIISFPGKKKDQTVNFKLRTNGLYTGKRKVNSKVTATILTKYVSTDKSVTTSYLYNSRFTATPSDPIVVFLRSVSSDRASILIQTLEESKVRVKYGIDANELTQGASTLQYAKEQIVILSNLIPETTYYLVVTAIRKDGTTLTSDIYTFKTAHISVAPQVDQETLIFTSADIVINEPYDKNSDYLSLNLPRGTSFNFRFRLQKYESVKQVQGIVRSKTVLGINNEEIIEPISSETTLFERQPGLFDGRFKASDIPGTYEIYLKVYDNNGNIVENKLAQILVSERFTVKNKVNDKPIEGAQILISYFNSRKKEYEIIPEKVIPIKNPSYTDIMGQISYPLPFGKYKAQIVAIGYKSEEIEFNIGRNPGEEYPMVSLSPQPFNLVTIGLYYGTIVRDISHSYQGYIQKLANSVRFFEINSLLGITILVYLTLLSFSSRLKIPLHSMIEYFLHRAKIATIHKKIGERIKGKIIDEKTGNVLSLADIFLIDSEKNKVVGHIRTNQKGDFTFLKYPDHSYELEVMRDGYKPVRFPESDIQAVEKGVYLLGIHKHDLGPTIKEKIKIYSEKILSIVFETMLILSIISETALGYALGWQKVVPFLCVSLLNIIFWIINLSHQRSEKNIF